MDTQPLFIGGSCMDFLFLEAYTEEGLTWVVHSLVKAIKKAEQRLYVLRTLL